MGESKMLGRYGICLFLTLAMGGTASAEDLNGPTKTPLTVPTKTKRLESGSPPKDQAVVEQGSGYSVGQAATNGKGVARTRANGAM
jgi:hypothetical protein